jgi:hypothetical protein
MDNMDQSKEFEMEYKLKATAEGLNVSAAVPAEQQAKLLEEFGKCAAGTCSCPSTQYDKLASIDVKQTADGVSVDLKAKAGETIDQGDIARCLDHTANLINP